MSERVPKMRLVVHADSVTGWRGILVGWRRQDCDVHDFVSVAGDGEMAKLVEDLRAAADLVEAWSNGDGSKTRADVL